MSPTTLKQFILVCLQTRWQPDKRTQLPTLWDNKDFTLDAFITTAKDNRLAPLLYQTLRHQNILTAQELAPLQQDYTYTAWRNLTIFQELTQIVTKLQEVNIPCLILKGAGLAEPIYNNIALRPLGDLDLLVPHQHVPQALSLVAELDFQQTHVEPRPGFYLTFENEIVLHKQKQLTIWLELHWSLFNLPYYQEKIDMDWFWQTAQDNTVQKTDVQLLGTEATLLHLCSHIVLHHQGDELHWLHDIAEVIYAYHEQIDWDLLLNKAQQYDLLFPLQQVLPVLKNDWSAPIPLSVLDTLNSLSLSPMEEKVISWLTAEDRSLHLRVWEDIASMPSWSHRWQYIFAYLFPTGEYIQHRHQIPDWWPRPFYHIYHWGSSALNLLPFR
ncbi:MAG TPA: nucleotidyltransferase family protein [Anaerolineae bacterium]|nr:nucleotidyltransferase family protein [Anaerolineae bacterium]